MYSDDRGVSVTVGYVLNFAVAALLISGLLVAGGGLIESQTKQVTSDELAVIGHQLADELSSADRLVRAGNVSTLSIRTELPRRTAAGGYRIHINTENNSDRGTIELRTSSPDLIVTVPFRVTSDLPDDHDPVTGGPVRIEYEAGELVVVSA
jgi:hypothetical protein